MSHLSNRKFESHYQHRQQSRTRVQPSLLQKSHQTAEPTITDDRRDKLSNSKPRRSSKNFERLDDQKAAAAGERRHKDARANEDAHRLASLLSCRGGHKKTLTTTRTTRLATTRPPTRRPSRLPARPEASEFNESGSAAATASTARRRHATLHRRRSTTTKKAH